MIAVEPPIIDEDFNASAWEVFGWAERSEEIVDNTCEVPELSGSGLDMFT